MEAEERKCPWCAEMVKREAVVCRYCGRNLPFVYSAEEMERRNKRTVRNTMLGVAAIATFAVLAAVGQYVSPSPRASTMAYRDPASCDAAIQDAQRRRIVRRISGNRIDVEDAGWAMALAEDKRALMALFLCSHLGGRPPSGLNDYVVAYGYRSGHRVAMASDAGVNLE